MMTSCARTPSLDAAVRERNRLIFELEHFGIAACETPLR
jgi:hypothetical protein